MWVQNFCLFILGQIQTPRVQVAQPKMAQSGTLGMENTFVAPHIMFDTSRNGQRL
jgi:hypothetical protein